MLQHFIHFIIYMAPLHTSKTSQLCFVIFKIAINITFCKRGSFFFPPHALLSGKGCFTYPQLKSNIVWNFWTQMNSSARRTKSEKGQSV